jgi:hypothetical protein
MKTALPLVVALLAPAVARGGEPQVAPQAVQAPAPAQAPKPATKAKPKAGPKKLKPGAVDVTMPFPPSVLTGDGNLECNISDKENGHQKLTIANGGGLEFDVAVSPIVDGTVTTAGPDKGGSYRFTSHLAKPATAKLPGVGTFVLDVLETKVVVEIARYQQPKGKGTELSFTSFDMNRRGIYVEFAGRGHATNGEQYSFRVNLGAPSKGGGRVKPATDDHVSHVAAKVVSFEAPVTTVVVTTTIDRTAP